MTPRVKPGEHIEIAIAEHDGEPTILKGDVAAFARAMIVTSRIEALLSGDDQGNCDKTDTELLDEVWRILREVRV